MFGYVTINRQELSKEAAERYGAFYCGLCRELKERHGLVGRMTLSYDMTFLLILLTSLYEPEEVRGVRACPPHPVKGRPFLRNAAGAYVSDMNVALAYHKCRDNWRDERKLSGLAQAGLLSRAYRRVAESYPDKCRAIEECVGAVNALERAEQPGVDGLANQTARMLREVYAYRPGDMWTDTLGDVGGGLGRFIYLMDAYEDLPADRRKKRFNPLLAISEREDFEPLCREALSLLIAESAEAFELLPLVQDVDILRNILYSGVWTRYAAIQKQRTPKEAKA